MSQTLAYIYHASHLIQHHITKELNKRYCKPLPCFVIQTKSYSNNACLCECMSYLAYLIASQHLRHQCIIILIHVHGIKARNKEKPLIQHVEDKQTIKQRNKSLESTKRDQTKAYYMEEIKKQKQKNSNQGFYACAYIGLHTQANCMHTHTSSLCTHAHTNTLKRTLTQKTRTKTKRTTNLTTQHALKHKTN